MTDQEVIWVVMGRLRQSMQRSLRRALAIPQEPSPLPAPDDPMYGPLRLQHDVIARMRGRPCMCGSCG